MRNKIRGHIIFDLDGTLIDSKQEIINTYKLVINELIVDPIPDFEKLNYGASLHYVLSAIYGNHSEKIEKAKSLFASLYDNSSFEETHLYSGVVETLNLLKSRDWQLYIATNKRFTPTLKILIKKGIYHYFSGVMATEMQPNVSLSKEEMIALLKQQFAFTEGYMVGDSSADIIAGQNQDLKTIAATYGYENRAIFDTQKPTYTIDFIDEIHQIL